MTRKEKQFIIETLHSDGCREEPQLHKVDDIDLSWRMGRRDFLATTVFGLAAFSLLRPGRLNSEEKTNSGCEDWIIAHKGGMISLDLSRKGNLLITKNEKMWKLPEGRLLGKLQRAQGNNSDLVINSSEKLIAGIADLFYNSETELCFWETTGGKIISRYHNQKYFQLLYIKFSVSPDLNMIAAVGKKQVTVFSFIDGKILVEIPYPEDYPEAFDIKFSPDEKLLIINWSGKEDIYFYSLPDGKFLKSIKSKNGEIGNEIRLSPDGKHLLYFTAEFKNKYIGYAAVVNIETGVEKRIATGLDSLTGRIQITADGKKLFLMDDEKKLLYCDFPSLNNKKMLFNKEKNLWDFMIDPTSSLGAFSIDMGSKNERTEIWDIAGLKKIQTIRRFHHLYSDAQFDKTGKYFISYTYNTPLTSRKIPVEAAVSGFPANNKIKPGENRPISFLITNNNRMVITASEDGQVRLWSFPDGKHLTCLFDPELVSKYKSVSQVEVADSDGNKFLKIITDGSALPSGSICTCNMVQGRAEPSSGGGSGSGGGSYCSCNQVCTCVPVK